MKRHAALIAFAGRGRYQDAVWFEGEPVVSQPVGNVENRGDVAAAQHVWIASERTVTWEGCSRSIGSHRKGPSDGCRTRSDQHSIGRIAPVDVCLLVLSRPA